MLLYYLFWMFMGFIKHFYIIFGTNLLTQSPVPVPGFSLVSVFWRKGISNGVETEWNLLEKLFLKGKQPGRLGVHARKAPAGLLEGSSTHQGALGGPGALWWVVPTSGAPWTASLLYKYPNIPETLGDSIRINSSRCRVQKHQIQSRHHLGGVHHVHWCLSDNAWVVLCRPTTP